MITPTVGRIVWFHPEAGVSYTQPWAALVTYVHSATMVNLAVFNENGNPQSRTSVPLWQGDGGIPAGMFCEWMPYQKGQAAKTEALEKQIGPTTA